MAKGKKTGGRRAGSLNKATVEAKAACAALVDDPAYRRSLGRRLRTGKLSPAMECLLWYYAKGKPKEEYQADQHITVSWQNEVTDRLITARKRLAGRDDS